MKKNMGRRSFADAGVSHRNTLNSSPTEMLIQPDIEIFPVPTSKEITIRIEIGQKMPNLRVEVISLHGKVLLTSLLGPAIPGTRFATFDIENLVDGFYFIRLKNGETSISNPFVIQH